MGGGGGEFSFEKWGVDTRRVPDIAPDGGGGQRWGSQWAEGYCSGYGVRNNALFKHDELMENLALYTAIILSFSNYKETIFMTIIENHKVLA